MKQYNLNINEAVLVTSKENKFYLTSYHSSNCYILLVGNDKYFFTDLRYYEEARKKLKNFKVVEISKNPLNTILKVLKKYKINILGIEKEKLLYYDYLNIERIFNDYKIIDISKNFKNLRIQKESIEINNIKKALEIANNSFIKLINNDIREGVTEKEVATKLEYYMKELGAEEKSFDTICAFGLNTSMPHAHITDKKLKNHDLITIDFGCIYNGYMSDTTRTFGFGTLDNEIKKTYSVVLENNLLITDMIKEGCSCSYLDKKSREHLLKFFDISTIKHSLGHGVGIEIHENPFLSIKSDEILKENEIVTVEPGVYLENYGIRIEDMILVKKNDKIKLSEMFENKLIEI